MPNLVLLNALEEVVRTRDLDMPDVDGPEVKGAYLKCCAQAGIAPLKDSAHVHLPEEGRTAHPGVVYCHLPV
jgi:hypothetical protein